MIGIKVPIKKTEPVKRFLIKNNVLSKDRKIIKKTGFIIFPVVEDKTIVDMVKSSFDFCDIVEAEFGIFKKITDYKDLLKDKLSKKEFELLPSAFDTLGGIIIIELPHKLDKKEKLIGKALLKTHKNISTILKKKGSHEGVFRTQKMKVIAGKNKKETVYRENGIILKIDVEKVYFSSRLGTERLRINRLVKEKEDVLVMFSGCGPYVFNISKNTKAMDVYGVEINPIGHKYALLNKRLNKSDNTHFILGDVKKVLPDFYNHIIGLKSSCAPKELRRKITNNPLIMEFHLFDDNLESKKIKKLEKSIESLKKRNIDVFVHMPFHILKNSTKDKKINIEKKSIDNISSKGIINQKKKVDLTGRDIDADIGVIKILGEFCIKHSIKTVVHPCVHFKEMTDKYDENRLIYNLSLLKKYFNYFYFENIPGSPFSGYEDIIRIGKRAGIKNICIDLAHLYMHYKNNNKLFKAVTEIKKNFGTYFHVSDSSGKKDGLRVGDGKIRFEKVFPLINKGVTEVKSKDESYGNNMISSFKKIKNRTKKFDRILMPLPKTADEFLDVALKSIKPKGTIHFYDFLHEKNIPDAAVNKISKACKKLKKRYKVLRWVKCGQHSPKTFRICVDFKILN